MIANPEFQRNVWLELTVRRLVLLAVVFAGIFTLTALIADPIEWGDSFRNVSMTIIGLTMYLWGTRVMADAVLDEIASGTWDGQRLTALSPVQMTLGKIFGAPVFVYLIVALAIGAWTGGEILERFGVFAGGASGDLIDLATLVISGLFAMLTAFWVSLAIATRSSGQKRRFQTTLGQIVGIIAGITVYNIIQIDVGDLMHSVLRGPEGIEEAPGTTFTAFHGFVVAALVWLMIGSVMLMRRELQIEHGPWVWLLFLIYWPAHVIFVATPMALSTDTDPTWPAALVAATIQVVIPSIYFMAFFEPKGFVALRQLAARIKQGDWRRASWRVPRSWIALPLLAVMMAVATLTLTDFATKFFDDVGFSVDAKEIARSTVFPISIFLFVLRDVALIHVWTADGGGRAHVAALIYLALLYGVVPGIFFYLDMPKVILSLFWPGIAGGTILGLIGPLVGAAVGVGWLIIAWRNAARIVPAEN